MLLFIRSADAAPSTAGAYALWLRLAAPRDVRTGKQAGMLGPGDYLYCGSARGPGGLRARLSRHFRKEKRLHWHVDQLTAVAAIKGVWIAEGGDECALNAALGALPTPLPGFGSSDCPRCVAHLRRIPAGARLPSAWENARKTAESLFPSLRVTAE